MNVADNNNDNVQYMNVLDSANDGVQYMNFLNTTNNDVKYMNVSNPMALCNVMRVMMNIKERLVSW